MKRTKFEFYPPATAYNRRQRSPLGCTFRDQNEKFAAFWRAEKWGNALNPSDQGVTLELKKWSGLGETRPHRQNPSGYGGVHLTVSKKPGT